MNALFDYGEVLFCFLPVFLVMALVAGGLLWNSLPSRTIKRKGPKDEDDDKHAEGGEQ